MSLEPSNSHDTPGTCPQQIPWQVPELPTSSTQGSGSTRGRGVECPPFPLAAAHRAQLEVVWGLSPAVIAARGYCTIPASPAGQQWLRQQGFSAEQVAQGGGLLIPIRDRVGAVVAYLFEPTLPRVGPEGRLQRCERVPGSRRHVDFGLFNQRKQSGCIVWTDGVRNADMAATNGFAAVNLNAAYEMDDGQSAVALTEFLDLESVSQEMRAIPAWDGLHFLAIDSDWDPEHPVAQALLKVGEGIEQIGARIQTRTLIEGDCLGQRHEVVVPFHEWVVTANLPCGPYGERVGLSEFFAHGGCGGEMFAYGCGGAYVTPLSERQPSAGRPDWSRLLEEMEAHAAVRFQRLFNG